MTDKFELNDGNIKKNSDTVTFEIPREKTNIAAEEQLEELKRDASLFLTCKGYVVDESTVHIEYSINSGFKSLINYVSSNRDLKCKIARNILAVDDLFGTQYTTILHPDNIYVDKSGQIKFAHRGIRSVLPPKEYSSSQLLQDLKNVFLYLFNASGDQDMIIHIQSATSINQLSNALELAPISNYNQPNSTTGLQAETKKTQSKNAVKPFNNKMATGKRSLIIGTAIGLILGMVLVYFVKVVPSSTTASTKATELNEQEDENEALRKQLKNEETIVKGYRFAIAGKTKEAIASFESIEPLDESEKSLLAEQYFKINTLESLTKLIEMDDLYLVKAVGKLVGLNSKEANEKILSIESDKPEIIIEQAWLNKDYKQVLEIYKTITDNKRAKLLAANSYIETDKPKESLKLAKALKNQKLQLASLQKEKKLVKADDSLKKDEKEDKLKSIDKAIDKLKK
ncbi:type VII secretion protein EssB/YukC [Virgibacillus oceani]|uniref:Type VII secretion protein EssB n=1 Tax=Virgibacillus oceani TaxID=1479511 RepID=A0A917H005_9BACI|nr:type VII secretion protein EssB/YukC [Virgibacillus oceani]GGG63041.1 hypothetical protein GCM10011398_03040 [Virgibacillus oceani]